ncbi:MAG: tetratricopeptide repeat protein, partial [Thermoanaerobaculia bacterium]|nr:tetratricopeptide repeat protein [Thermoanaerobaculia bacterium]
VDYVVEGSVQRDGDRIRLQTQVVRPDPEEHLLAETFERPFREALSLHAAAARAIAGAVKAPIAAAEEVRVATAKAVEPSAFEAYLQARYWSGKFGDEELLKARGYYERAVALDPSFADAWAGLADVIWRHGLYFSGASARYAEADAAARRALQLDDQQAAAHAVLSSLAKSRWDWATAESYARRAVELDPSSALVRRNLWHLLAPLGRLEAARREIEVAVRMDPLSAHAASNLGMQLILEGRYAEAEKELLRALELDPDFSLTHGWLWLVYCKLGRDPERGRELVAYVDAMGFGRLVPELERRLTRDGYDAALRWVAKRAADESKGDPNQVGFVAGFLAESGQLDEAMAWLRFGYEKRVWEMPWLTVTPDYDRLRDRPDFQALVAKLGLPGNAS